MLMIGWKPATNDGGDLSERVRPEILARDKVDAAVVAVDQLCDLPIAEAGELADGVLVLAWHLLHCGPSAISPSSARAHTNCVRTPRCLTHRHSPVHLRLIPEVGHPAEKLIGELRSLGVSVSSQVVETRRNTIFGPQQMDRLLHHAGPIRSPGHAPSTGSLVPEGTTSVLGSSARVRPPWLQGPSFSDATANDISALACQHCRTVGSLSDEMPEGAPCPSCSFQALEVVGGWMT